jgi:GT2 family glycosyltransferase
VVDAPSVSVLIPAYRSERTIARTLASLRRQTLTPIEVVVVDSSPVDSTGDLVRAEFPEVRYHHSPTRLLPHAARNLAAGLSRGELIASLDPDAVAHPDWLENLVSVYKERGGAVSGGVGCYGGGWTRTGSHLAKFDKWLPGGEVRRLDIGATVNLLLSRDDLQRTGGWESQYMIADTLLSWTLGRLGIAVWFAPQAVVEHDHTETWFQLLQEMYSRGREFGHLRRRVNGWRLPQVLVMTAVSILPVRLIKVWIRVLFNAARAGMFGAYVVTFPIVATSQGARLAGEIAGYFDQAGP